MPLFEPISGETPIDDFSELKVRGIATRSELNNVEARNVLQATMKYLVGRPSKRVAPFDLKWSLRLHAEMFGNVWGWAGKIRQTQVGSEELYAKPGDIEPRLYDLFQCLPLWAAEPLVSQAAMLHHRAVVIHPFLNGNGRWSRMLANIWLAREGANPTRWPDELTAASSPIREQYLLALREADHGDFQPLIDLHGHYSLTLD